MYQAILPLIPEGASRINDFVSVYRGEKSWTYFSYDQPVYRHDAGDRIGFYLVACQMINAGLCRECEILDAFGVPKRTLDNWLEKHRTVGISAFFHRPARKKKATILTPEVLAEHAFSPKEALYTIFHVIFEGSLTEQARKEFVNYEITNL